ncbi:MAG: glycerophosphodiester phosphodiesterase [Acidobacteria bacterium]|nr:MAG: glycerophosphodiester phosphodiesterase [Acidobacteriota bacterium]
MRLRLILGALAAAGAIGFACGGGVLMTLPSPGFPAVHGHRGASAVAPENTLAAFRRAIEMGADALEMDLQLTKDGAVVVVHDATLERTTDRSGRIADLTLAEVQQADAGIKKGPAYRGERIPTLDQVIELVQAIGGGRVRLNLELKYHVQGTPPPDLERAALAVLRRAGFTAQVFLQSFQHAVLPRLTALEPGIPTGVLVGRRDAPRDAVALVRQFQATYLAPEFRLVTGPLVSALHAAGIPVVAWTVNEPAEMQRLLADGVGRLAGDGIISDHPDRLVALRGAGGR